MNQHDDLGFVDNLDLFSNPYDQMLEKHNLAVNASKSRPWNKENPPKAMIMNTNNLSNIDIDNDYLKYLILWIYVVSVVNHIGGNGNDVKSRLAKSHIAIGMNKKVWKWRLKLRIFQ